MTKVIIHNVQLSYPIGPYIHGNLPSIKQMARSLNELYGDKPITLWIGGSSGALIGGIIANELSTDDRDIKINYAYKKAEPSHHSGSIGYSLDNSVNVIVDDFVVTGNTINRIIDYMNISRVTPDCLCVGNACTARGLKKLSYLPEIIIANAIKYSRLDVGEDGSTTNVDHTITQSGDYDLVEYFSEIVI